MTSSNYLYGQSHGSHIFVVIINIVILLYRLLKQNGQILNDNNNIVVDAKRKAHVIKKKEKKVWSNTSGGINAASLFLLLSAVFSACFSCFSRHFFADFILSVKKYSPVSSWMSIYIYHDYIIRIYHFSRKFYKREMRKHYYI